MALVHVNQSLPKGNIKDAIALYNAIVEMKYTPKLWEVDFMQSVKRRIEDNFPLTPAMMKSLEQVYRSASERLC